jgi:hypothetical protein
MAPRDMFTLAHNLPPCASMIERQIDSPSPKPLGLVVNQHRTGTPLQRALPL